MRRASAGETTRKECVVEVRRLKGILTVDDDDDND